MPVSNDEKELRALPFAILYLDKVGVTMSDRNRWRLLPIILTATVTVACSRTEQREVQVITEPYASQRVFVLLVNPHSQNEGIYTISYDNQQQVLMFESREDANRYNSDLAPNLGTAETADREVDTEGLSKGLIASNHENQ